MTGFKSWPPTGLTIGITEPARITGDAHLKNLLIGHQVLIPITDGRLDFGPWQQVYYAEFDERRNKRVIIKIIGE